MTRNLRTFLLAVAAVGSLVVTTGEAAAWSCRAKSRYADGWGYSPVLATAREEAKLKCQLTTPRRTPCRIVYCRR
jgi:hypothetical protein